MAFDFKAALCRRHAAELHLRSWETRATADGWQPYGEAAETLPLKSCGVASFQAGSENAAAEGAGRRGEIQPANVFVVDREDPRGDRAGNSRGTAY